MQWLVDNQEVVLAVLGAVAALATSMGWSWVSAVIRVRRIIIEVIDSYGASPVSRAVHGASTLEGLVTAVEATGLKDIKRQIKAKTGLAGPLVKAVLQDVVQKVDPKPLSGKQKAGRAIKKVGLFVLGNLIARRLG